MYEQVEKHHGEKIYTYGPIIHNEEVIKDMASRGVSVLNTLEELKELTEGIVIIRSPVSYTHLDVYKRQVVLLTVGVGMLYLIDFCVK